MHRAAAPTERVTGLSPAARLVLVLAGAFMLATLGGQFALIKQQRDITRQQRTLAQKQLQLIRPLVEDARPLVDDTRDGLPRARAIARRADRLAREAVPLVRDAAPLVAEIRPLVRGLRVADLPRTTRRTGTLVDALLRADAAGALDDLGVLIPQLTQLVPDLRRASRVAVRLDRTQDTALDILKEALELQRQALAVNRETLAIAKDTNVHAASVDQKFGGPLPARGR